MKPRSALREWRLQSGLSIRALEKSTGINRGKLSQYERGLEIPTADLERITAALGRSTAP